MLYLKATNLTKAYTDKPLVDHVDFSLSKGQKIALVAKNGAGKSTFIRLLMGQLDVTDGTIERRKWVKIGFLSQSLDLDPEALVIDELFQADNATAQLIKSYEQIIINPEADPEQISTIISKMEEEKARDYEVKVNIIISKLSLGDLLNQQVKTLSWWEGKRVALAKALFDEPDLLILDEPTNHLDLQMIERLEYYLSQSDITLFMVTHDRYFLESVCTDIVELDRGKLFYYPGNYSYFLEKKALRQENEKVEMHKLKQVLRKELAWMRTSPRGRQTKQNFRQQRFEGIEHTYHSRKDILDEESVKLEISMEERKLGSKILKIKHLYKSFWEKKIIENFSHEFRHQERIWIIGKNGVGKSTFLNIIMEKETLDSGVVSVGERIVLGYYQQKDIVFPANKRVIDVVRDVGEYMTVAKGEKLSATTLLERFLFPVKQHHMYADALSGGEKRRLYLLTILMKNPNFLILDEPTNDLDLLTLGILEDFLNQFQWCLIVVSHDRFFMDRVVDQLFVFEGNGVIKDFWGTYTEYKEKQDAKILLSRQEKKSEGKKIIQPEHEIPKKLSYMEKRELDQLIKDIDTLEKRKEKINTLFDDKDLHYDDIKKLSLELGEILRNLEIKEARRFELIARAET